MSVLNYAVLTACINHIFERDLERLPPFNQILRDGLILKRLSVIGKLSDTKLGEPQGDKNAGSDNYESHERKTVVGVDDQEMDERIMNMQTRVDRVNSLGLEKEGEKK